MMDLSFEIKIGQEVYSPKFGIGKVLRKDYIDSTSSEFYIVESTLNQTRIMVPVMNSKKQLRGVITPKQAESAIDSLEAKTDFESQAFASKKDRVKHFQQILRSVDLKETVNALKFLNDLGDKGKVEQQIFEKMLDDLALELSYVMRRSRGEMNAKLHECLI